MNIVSVILLVSLKTAYARKCYTCLANSDKACDDKQKVTSCTSEEQCVMLKYTTSIEERRVFKFCQNKKFLCDKECSKLLKAGHKSCITACCDHDHCNKPTADKKVVGSKRSLTENVPNSGAYSKMNLIVIHIVLVMQLLSWVILNRL